MLLKFELLNDLRAQTTLMTPMFYSGKGGFPPVNRHPEGPNRASLLKPIYRNIGNHR